MVSFLLQEYLVFKIVFHVSQEVLKTIITNIHCNVIFLEDGYSSCKAIFQIPKLFQIAYKKNCPKLILSETFSCLE